MASSMGGNYHRDGGSPQNSLWAYNCQPELRSQTRRMPSGDLGLRAEGEPDPYIGITTFSYGDGGGVKGSRIEIDNIEGLAQYILISEDVVEALFNAR